jgi:hypothetical protein
MQGSMVSIRRIAAAGAAPAMTPVATATFALMTKTG